ncbi:MAG: hypothetical protein WA146_06160 [Thiobacillus sp.]
MKGMPMQMPAMKVQQCLTDQDIVNGKAYASNKNKDCKISEAAFLVVSASLVG